jgi:hypothetical protein
MVIEIIRPSGVERYELPDGATVELKFPDMTVPDPHEHGARWEIIELRGGRGLEPAVGVRIVGDPVVQEPEPQPSMRTLEMTAHEFFGGDPDAPGADKVVARLNVRA